MMSAENFESWAETLEITYLFPHLKRDMKETREAINDKSYKKWATFEKVFPEVITKQKKSLVKSTIKSVAKKKAQGKSKK